MRKWNRVVVAVLAAVCLLIMPGCSQLFSMHDRPTPTVEPSPTPVATPAATPEVTRTQTPSPSPTNQPTPTATATLAPLPKDLVQVGSLVLDVDGDGRDDSVVIASTDGDYGNVYIGIQTPDGYDRVSVEEGFFAHAWQGNAPGGAPCVLVTLDLGSDDYMTCVFSFSGSKPVKKYEMYAFVSNVSGSSVTVKDCVDLLGSWFYTCEYKIINNFTLQRTTEMMLDMEYKDPPHVIRPLPVEMLEGGLYSAETLPVGTLIYPVSTDGSTYMNFRLEDGRVGRIVGTFDEGWTFKIGGLDETEYFDNLDYWG